MYISKFNIKVAVWEALKKVFFKRECYHCRKALMLDLMKNTTILNVFTIKFVFCRKFELAQGHYFGRTRLK